jgi:hypothetical protein
MPDSVTQVEVRGDCGQVVGVVVHVVSVRNLGRAPVTATVMRNDPVTLPHEEQQLVVPVVGRQRPSVTEHDWLSRTPVLVENLRTVVAGDRWHFIPLSDAFSRAHHVQKTLRCTAREDIFRTAGSFSARFFSSFIVLGAG